MVFMSLCVHVCACAFLLLSHLSHSPHPQDRRRKKKVKEGSGVVGGGVKGVINHTA